MTLVSRILGFVRDILIARLFGAATGTDAFFVAFKIPNFMRRLFAEGAFSQAFVPVLSEYRARNRPGELQTFLDGMSGVLTLALLGMTVIGIVLAPVFIAVFAPGFVADTPKYELASAMLRLTFPYLLFISLTALAGGILNAFGRFAVPALTPALLNLAMIGTALWLAPRLDEPVMALAWGVLIAGIAQLAFQVPFLARAGLLPRPRPAFRDPGVRKVLRLIVPALFGVSVTQINLLIDTVIASFLITGSVSWLYYSDRMIEFPLGVFGIALATVILPGLSRRHAQDRPELFTRTLDWALRWVMVVTPAAALGLALLAGPILSTLFQYQAFGAHDVLMSTRSLIAFCVGLPAFVAIKVLANGYYARQDTATPVRIGIKAMLANIVFNLILVWPLAHAGLALATSCSAMLNGLLLYRGLRAAGVYRPMPGWGRLAFTVIAANGAMGAVLVLGPPPMEWWIAAGALERSLELALWAGVGALAFAITLFATGIRGHGLLDGAHADEPPPRKDLP